MYSILLNLHSILRWFVLISLIYSIVIAYKGWLLKGTFKKPDNLARVLTATIAHVQLIIGIVLYFISPMIKYFLHNFKDMVHNKEFRFYGLEHTLFMFIAIVLLTIGSSAAKRKKTDAQKFKTMAIWFSIALIIIIIAIPWPFTSFTAQRPWFRFF